jgi:hypothetical protein
MAEQRKYGVAATIPFPLIDFGGTDFEDTPVTIAAADSRVMKDEGAFVQTTNPFEHTDEGIYEISLTATEMEAARIVIRIVDVTDPKLWEDQALYIETYGHPSAQHPTGFDNIFPDGMVYVDSDDGVASTDWPYGTANHPTNTLANAKIIADANNIKTIHVYGPHTLAAAMEEYTFIGAGWRDASADLFNLSAESVEKSTFRELALTGSSASGTGLADVSYYYDCAFNWLVGIHGFIQGGVMLGQNGLLAGGLAFIDDVVFYNSSVLTVNSPVLCQITNMKGTLALATMSGGTMTVHMLPGASLTINNTCDGGTLTITGDGTVTDNSAGTTVNIIEPRADIIQWNSTAVATPDTAGHPKVTVKDGTGTGEINTDSGKIVEVSTLTGHTAQTGDNFARLGAPDGASIAADIAVVDSAVDAVGVIVSVQPSTIEFEARTLPSANYFAASTDTVDVGKVSGSSTAADNLELAALAYSVIRGLAGTALPNAVANAAGGLPVTTAGTLDLDTQLANTHEITVARMGALTDWINGGRLDLLLDLIKDKTDGLNFDGNNVLADVMALADIDLSDTMKASILTQAAAALVAINLDHLMKTAVGDRDDMTDEVANGTVLANLMTKTDGTTSDFDPDDDSLESISDSESSPPTTDQIVAALRAATVSEESGAALTVGNFWRILTASVAGNWRSKPTDATVDQLMDADDGVTPLLEMSLSATTPFKTITVLI